MISFLSQGILVAMITYRWNDRHHGNAKVFLMIVALTHLQMIIIPRPPTGNQSLEAFGYAFL